ncbi:ribonuclease P protein component [Pleomorphochaeta sp. DL1XJH-081]|jgi:ribonuclease P protein component|uniref:ribonuclease P protein component n=1 Tax=Pleomorphochaeta sp. DL1XJH-081 TaxID=3409690 RepID=UPI003BB59CB8
MRKSLTKQEIVKKKPEIDAIFRKGKKFSCSGVRLLVAPNSLGVNRIIVIPVRHYGNAVERNRIRRQIKEIWRNEKPEFQSGFDFAFVVYPGKALDYATQRKQLIRLFSQAKVYLAN